MTLQIQQTDDRKDKAHPPVPWPFDVEAVVKAAGINTGVTPLKLTLILNDNPGEYPTYVVHEADENHWHVHLFVRKKDELSYGSARALNRAVSRAVFTIDAVRTHGEFLTAMYSPQAFEAAATAFADKAPEAVK